MTWSSRKSLSSQASPTAGQDGDLTQQGVDDPVFEQAVDKVFLAFGLVITLDAAPRHDLGGKYGNPPSSPILRGDPEDNSRGRGFGPRPSAEPEAEFVAAAVAVNVAGDARADSG